MSISTLQITTCITNRTWLFKTSPPIQLRISELCMTSLNIYRIYQVAKGDLRPIYSFTPTNPPVVFTLLNGAWCPWCSVDKACPVLSFLSLFLPPFKICDSDGENATISTLINKNEIPQERKGRLDLLWSTVSSWPLQTGSAQLNLITRQIFGLKNNTKCQS